MRFAFHCYVEQWPQVIESVARSEPHLRKLGRPLAADMLVRAYGQLRDDLVKLGAKEAIAGTATLRAIEKQTRVRPDTVGGGGPRLGDALLVRAIDTGGLLPGSVGIADLDVLDANVPWWITNEIGSSGRVGGRLYGHFFGGAGDAPPDPSQFREHALFAPGPNPASGLGIIQRPIPARRFIEESVKVIDHRWRTQFEVIRGRFEARLETVARTYR